MVQPEVSVIGNLRTIPIDSIGIVTIPLRSYFSDLSICAPTRLTISSDVIEVQPHYQVPMPEFLSV